MPSVKLFDICLAKPKGNDDGVWWHRIGRASENERGQISLFFDSLPIPGKDGRCQAMLFEQKDEDQRRTRQSSSSSNLRGSASDDIPF